MTDECVTATDPLIQAVVVEMHELIRDRYPNATFNVGRLGHMPGIRVTATVDLDDPIEMVDLFVHRLVDIQVEEGLPLHVMPQRTPERIAAMLREEQERSWRPSSGPVEAVG